MQRYFAENTTYKDSFNRVLSWAEWAAENGVSAQDRGIDLVAEKENGELCAIQCKFYHPTHKIDKQDIDSSFTESALRTVVVAYRRREVTL